MPEPNFADTWADYWSKCERHYRASTEHPWHLLSMAAVQEHGDYADFAGFEQWMNAKMVDGDDLFAPVWSAMGIQERIGLYGIMCEVLEKAHA